MGGGEGVGSLQDITIALYRQFLKLEIYATIFVICGRNQNLKNALESKDWQTIRQKKNVLTSYLSISPLSRQHNDNSNTTTVPTSSIINVIPLGFISNIAEYMVAADVLITKAGPGTIAEATALGLPIMLTSFLPGQEEGNVDFVQEHKFGAFQSNPCRIAEEVSRWMQSRESLNRMSQNALSVGNPNAAAQIATSIRESTLRWEEDREHVSTL